jgi:hypothetical protein
MSDDCMKDGCAACELAELTGRPHSDFEASEYEMPDFEELDDAE